VSLLIKVTVLPSEHPPPQGDGTLGLLGPGLTLTLLNGIELAPDVIAVVPCSVSDHGVAEAVMHSVNGGPAGPWKPAGTDPKSTSGVLCVQPPADPKAIDDVTVACIDCVCVAVDAWLAGADASHNTTAQPKRKMTAAYPLIRRIDPSIFDLPVRVPFISLLLVGGLPKSVLLLPA
jgi:hypothetical protein